MSFASVLSFIGSLLASMGGTVFQKALSGSLSFTGSVLSQLLKPFLGLWQLIFRGRVISSGGIPDKVVGDE